MEESQKLKTDHFPLRRLVWSVGKWLVFAPCRAPRKTPPMFLGSGRKVLQLWCAPVVKLPAWKLSTCLMQLKGQLLFHQGSIFYLYGCVVHCTEKYSSYTTRNLTCPLNFHFHLVVVKIWITNPKCILDALKAVPSFVMLFMLFGINIRFSCYLKGGKCTLSQFAVFSSIDSNRSIPRDGEEHKQLKTDCGMCENSAAWHT